MPRLPRRPSASGFYHVIIRGNGRRILFESDADRWHFLSLLEKYGNKYGIDYLAWCLMDNHVHLLICDSDFNLSKAMHDIGFLFAQYYNSVNEHVGSVFQSRYTSMPIENENYLLEVMRYIHRNPIRAGLSESLSYPWSSFDEYIRGSWLAKPDLILGLFSSVDEFWTFCSQPNAEEAQKITASTSGRLTDVEALEEARRIIGTEVLSRIQRLGKQDRDEYLRKLSLAGLSVRQIARITGLGKSTVSRACSLAVV